MTGPRPPTAADQVAFLGQIERLLSEGQFVATYKYALLVAMPICRSSTAAMTGVSWTFPSVRSPDSSSTSIGVNPHRTGATRSATVHTGS